MLIFLYFIFKSSKKYGIGNGGKNKKKYRKHQKKTLFLADSFCTKG